MNTFQRSEPEYPAFLVGLCVALLLSTLALVTLGGVVRITGSGLGCPDWPLCHGSLIPPPQLSAWIEYSHRLAASMVSLEVAVLAVLAWWKYRGHRWILVPATTAVGLLIVQIVLGALTVLNEIPPAVAWIHTAVAMGILACVAAPVCAVYGPLRALAARWAAQAAQQGARPALPRLLAFSVAAVYVLLLTGAYVTRSGASGACTGFPACGSATDSAAVQGLQDIHMLHRIMAAGTGALLLLTVAEAWRTGRQVRGLRPWAAAIAGLFLAQAGLGITNVLLHLPIWSRGLHLTVGATLWATVVLLALTLWRSTQLAAVEGPAETPVRASRAAKATG